MTCVVGLTPSLLHSSQSGIASFSSGIFASTHFLAALSFLNKKNEDCIKLRVEKENLTRKVKIYLEYESVDILL